MVVPPGGPAAGRTDAGYLPNGGPARRPLPPDAHRRRLLYFPVVPPDFPVVPPAGPASRTRRASVAFRCESPHHIVVKDAARVKIE